jgi:hypothetical protein
MSAAGAAVAVNDGLRLFAQERRFTTQLPSAASE